MTTRSRRKSLDTGNENSPEQKSVSQRARELFSRHRKRLTISGGRRNRVLDTLNEVESCGDLSISSSVSPPKKAKRLLGITSPSTTSKKGDDSKGSNENDASLFLTPRQRRSHRLAPLATLIDDLEDFNSIPSGGADETTPKTPLSERPSFDRSFKTKSKEGTPLRSIPSSIGRSLSALRSAGRSLHILKMQTSVASFNSIQRNDSRNNNDLSTLERTPTKSSLAIVRQLSSSSVSKVANAFLKGLVTGPRSHRSRVRYRENHKEEDLHRNDRRLSTAVSEEERLLKQREQYNIMKSAIHVLKEEITDLATTEEILYDAIVCDITPSCKPISDVSKLILERVGEEVLDDIDSELILKKKFILTESGKFKACKYIFFVIDYGTPGCVEKTWQDMRFVFHNFIEKAIEHEGITSLLLPYLYTGEPIRDQAKVANAAISSINHLVQQIGLGNITKLDIGGVTDGYGCYEYYADGVEQLLLSLAPNMDGPLSTREHHEHSFGGDAVSLNVTSIDDSFYVTANNSSLESSN